MLVLLHYPEGKVVKKGIIRFQVDDPVRGEDVPVFVKKKGGRKTETFFPHLGVRKGDPYFSDLPGANMLSTRPTWVRTKATFFICCSDTVLQPLQSRAPFQSMPMKFLSG